jgi:2-polyprenyl-3-methyl-5-hydroxy-6-metoxy-1,4-benzoquinol methylase
MEASKILEELRSNKEQYEVLLQEHQGLKQRIQNLQDSLRREKARVRLLEKQVVCPVCATRKVNYHLQVRGHYGLFNLGRCSACGLIFLVDDRNEFQNEIVYNARVENMAHGMIVRGGRAGGARDLHDAYEQERNLVFSLLSQRIQKQRPGGRILDVGCGDGYFLTFFQDPAWQGLGVDYNPENSATARKRGIQVFQGPWEEFSPDEPLDVITMIEFIEHIHRPIELLRWARRLLAEEGMLLIQTGNVESREARRHGEKWAYLEAAPDHCVFFSPSTVSQALEQAGFRASYGGPGDEEVMTIVGYPLEQDFASESTSVNARQDPASKETFLSDRQTGNDSVPSSESSDRHARHCAYLRGIIKKKDQEILRLRRELDSWRETNRFQGKTYVETGENTNG